MDKRETINIGVSQRKMLSAISSLETEGYEGSAEGLSKLLKGVEDFETSPFVSAPFYGFWPSFSKKKLKGRLTQLVRHGFLKTVWVKEENDYFLVLTDLGKAASLDMPLVKKASAKVPETHTIIKITKGENR